MYTANMLHDEICTETKQQITTNMLGVVDWIMKFLYVLPGWEGSATDSRVLRDAMSRQDAFVVP